MCQRTKLEHWKWNHRNHVTEQRFKQYWSLIVIERANLQAAANTVYQKLSPSKWEDEELTDEEKKCAWAEYEKEMMKKEEEIKRKNDYTVEARKS